MFIASRIGLLSAFGLVLDMPMVTGYSTWSRTTDSTSHSITMPSGIISGELLICIATFDGSVTLTPSAGWVTRSHNPYSTYFTTAIFVKTADGSDVLTITSSISQQGTAIVYRIKDGDLIEISHRQMTAVSYNFIQPAVRVGLGKPGVLMIVTCSTSSTVTAIGYPFDNQKISVSTGSPTNDGTYSDMEAFDDTYLIPSPDGYNNWYISSSAATCIGNTIAIARNPSSGWRVSPIVVSATTSVCATAVNQVLQVPTAASVGDLLIAFVSCQAYSSSGAYTSSSGWSRISTSAISSTGTSLSIFTKTASSDNQLVVTTGTSRMVDAIVYCVRNATGVSSQILNSTATYVYPPTVTLGAPTDFLCITALASAANREFSTAPGLAPAGYVDAISTLAYGSHYPIHTTEKFITNSISETPAYWYSINDVSAACVTATVVIY